MEPKLKPISDQVVVITGASSGIGLAAACLAHAHGAKVVLAARSIDTLREVAREFGGSVLPVQCDVSKREDLERVASEAASTFGRIDTWVNNAGVSIYGKLTEVSEEDSKRLFDTNFWGVYNGSLVALRYLRVQGGALINVGSEVSETVVPLQGIYSASKHAVKGFTDALRIEIEEVEKLPISITLIQPTAVDTPYPQHAKNYMAQEPKLPTPQIAPEQVAEAILEAASNPTRAARVGLMSKVNTTVAKLMPSLGDKLSAMQVNRQQYDEEPRNPDGTLYQAGEQAGTSGRVCGTGGVESRT